MSGVRPFKDPAVKAAFARMPDRLRERLLGLRELIFETADETDSSGSVVECLKWGQPAYLTEKPKTGSTIRIGAIKGKDTLYGLFVHCQSRLVPSFRAHYADELRFEGNRAVLLSLDEPIPVEPLKHCIRLALTYHAAKNRV
jgi:hypothetical protein